MFPFFSHLIKKSSLNVLYFIQFVQIYSTCVSPHLQQEEEEGAQGGGRGVPVTQVQGGEEAGSEISGESEFFFNVCFCDVWKNGFLYTNGAPYHVDRLGGQPQCGGGGVGWRKTKSFPPPEVSAPQSCLQSIHIAEVHFDFYKNKIQLRRQRSQKPVLVAPQLGGGTGGLGSGQGAVYLSVRIWKQVSRGTEGCGGGEAEGSGAVQRREL